VRHAILAVIVTNAVVGLLSAWALEEDTDVATSSPPAPTALDTSNAPPARAVQPANITLPPELAEIVRLAQSGVSDDVLVAYIQKSPAKYSVTADQIVYMKDLGISERVFQAMLANGGQIGAAGPTPTVPQNPAPAIPGGPGTPAPEATDTNAAPPTVTLADDEYFHEALSPYGSWLYLPDYGWCWQPTVVVVNPLWQPYCDSGYWMWTDCGWYWRSYYSWGWAPFHYGRWCRYSHYGWVWCPDRVWGPSWVCWRYTGGYCGWAPLPPGARFRTGLGWTYRNVAVGVNFDFHVPATSFTFVHEDHFTDRHWEAHRASVREGNRVFVQSTERNDVTVGPNNRIINRGIDPQRIEAAAHTRLNPVPVETLVARQRLMRSSFEHPSRPLAASAPWGARSPDREPQRPSTHTTAVPWDSRLQERTARSEPAPAPTRAESRREDRQSAPRSYSAPAAPAEPARPAAPVAPAAPAPSAPSYHSGGGGERGGGGRGDR
jgi:hypothetical protein